MAPLGGAPLAWLLLAALVGACGPAGAESAPADAGPGRIAVAGAFPSGFVGLLARYGMPRDVLLDYQLGAADRLSRYDLLIIAGYSQGVPAALPAMEQMLERGGSILIDCSLATAGLLRWGANRRAPGLLPLLAASGRATTAFRLAGAENPLRQDVGSEDTFPAPRASLAPAIALPQFTTVLAEYVTPAARQPRKAARFPNVAAPASVPAAPAILLVQRGPGKIILCGPGIALGTALQGLDYDRLILGMLRVLTDGRAVPQFEPEGPRLGRKQSSRSLQSKGRAPEATGELNSGEDDAGTPAVPERPDGPGKPGPLPAGFALLEEEPAPEFNLSGRLEGKPAELLLNYWSPAHSLRVTLDGGGVRIARTAAGKTTGLAVARASIPQGTPFVIKERAGRLVVAAGSAIASASIAGIGRGRVAARGAPTSLRYQPVEPAAFSDDFMRTSDEAAGWETYGGTWKTAPVQNPELAANPFSYRVEAAAEPATALAGYPFWDDYRFSVSVRVEAGDGMVGLGLYAQDAENLLLLQARVRTAEAPLEDGFALVRLAGGKPQILSRAAGGLVPGQWYRIQVKAEGPWVGAFVDGQKVLVARDTTFTGGRIALRAERASARFDDVLVEPAAARSSPGQRLVARVPAFAGVIDVDSWAGPATPWEPSATVAGLFWRRGAFFGDVGMRFDVPPLPDNGEVVVLIDGDGQSLEAGYVLHLWRAGDSGVLELRRAGKVLGRARVNAAGGVTLGLRREGGRVLGLVDGQAVVKAAYAPGVGGARLAFRAIGFRPRVSMIALWSARVRDYTFDTAPVDWWVGSGEWDVTNRWSCTPDWSWFGGYSPAVAAIWHKQALQGDVVLDLYAAPKMIGTGAQRREQLADFNAVLCGDGASVESGYSFVVAENGRGARILRQGQVVAQNPSFRFFSQAHNRWANIRVEKRGATVRLTVEGQVVLQWEDPEPLPGGYAGVWTRNNGMIIPRITLYFEGLAGRLLSLRGA